MFANILILYFLHFHSILLFYNKFFFVYILLIFYKPLLFQEVLLLALFKVPVDYIPFPVYVI